MSYSSLQQTNSRGLFKMNLEMAEAIDIYLEKKAARKHCSLSTIYDGVYLTYVGINTCLQVVKLLIKTY